MIFSHLKGASPQSGPVTLKNTDNLDSNVKVPKHTVGFKAQKGLATRKYTNRFFKFLFCVQHNQSGGVPLR